MHKQCQPTQKYTYIDETVNSTPDLVPLLSDSVSIQQNERRYCPHAQTQQSVAICGILKYHVVFYCWGHSCEGPGYDGSRNIYRWPQEECAQQPTKQADSISIVILFPNVDFRLHQVITIFIITPKFIMFGPHGQHPDDDGHHTCIQESISHATIEYLETVPQNCVIETPPKVNDGDQKQVNLPVPEDANIVDHDQQYNKTSNAALNDKFESELIGSQYQNLPNRRLHSKVKAKVSRSMVRACRVNFLKGAFMRVQVSKNSILVPRQYDEVVKARVVLANPPTNASMRNCIVTKITANIVIIFICDRRGWKLRKVDLFVQHSAECLLLFIYYIHINNCRIMVNHIITHHPTNEDHVGFLFRMGIIILGSLRYILLIILFTMSILYQNKTVVDPYRDGQLKNQKQTTAFASKKQRFNYKLDRSPGPGSYQYRTTNYQVPAYQVHRNSEKQSPIKREHQWIWGSGRMSFVKSQNYSTYIGPGSYNLGMHEAVVGKTNWGKSERFNHRNKVPSVLPGPGSYESLNENYKSNVGSVFKSKSPRTFIEKLISESSLPDLKKTEVQQFIQNPEISNVEEQKKSLVKEKSDTSLTKYKGNSSVFASKIPRFSDNNEATANLGPGKYEITQLNKNKSKEKLPKIIIVRGNEKKRIPNKSEPELPGPGSYQLNMRTIEKQLESSKKSIVISNEPRFATKQQKIPGPGYYMQNKNAYKAEMQKLQRISPQKPSFNTSSDRIPPELPTKSNPLCSYNLEYYDLQYRLKKNQQHIEKLKIMEVTLPAFNSKAKR